MDERADAWLEAIEEPLRAAYPQMEPSDLRILDAGCGPGLFSVLLARRGYNVWGADYTPNMLDRAKENAAAVGCAIQFVEADAEALPFDDAMFHAVVSRNLTWNLIHPCKAYAEWARVLVEGGVIVNFDANWYRYLFDEESRRAYEEDRTHTHEAGLEEACEVNGYEKMEAIAREVPLSPKERPAWDLDILRETGLEPSVDTDIWQRVWNAEEQVNFASTPLFRVTARKLG